MLLEMDGWVMLMGVDIRRCSCMHQAETKYPFPKELAKRFATPEEIQKKYPEDIYLSFGTPPDDAWVKIQAEVERMGLIRNGRIGNAECLLFQARPIV